MVFGFAQTMALCLSEKASAPAFWGGNEEKTMRSSIATRVNPIFQPLGTEKMSVVMLKPKGEDISPRAYKMLIQETS